MLSADADPDVEALVVDSATRLFADVCAASASAGDGAATWPDAGWTMVAEAGLPAALAPADRGGVGAGAAMALSRLSGVFALPLPLQEAMAANWLLAQAGMEMGVEPLTVSASRLELTRERGGGWRLQGRASRTAWGRRCTLVACAAMGPSVFVVRLPAGAGTVVRGGNLAGEPRDDLSFDQPIADDDLAPAPPGLDADDVHALGAALRTAQIAGALGVVADMTIAYAGQRKQFGRPIGGFQAIQQQLAVLAEQAAAGRMAAEIATDGVRCGLDRRRIAVGKIRAGEAAGVATAIAHQVHGAIGFTQEHSLHRFTRRLLSWRDEFGSEAHWSERLGRQMAGAGADRLWTELTAI